ncbi:MAG: sulfatase-like hydrolase/transferase [Luteitalea sp.]|nr:sulfatase-like hydrolase/transferase [Luteitalea sp.]
MASLISWGRYAAVGLVLAVTFFQAPTSGRTASAAAAGTSTSSRLNIISIVTDDQAYWAMGASGNREIRTPNMDRLAREGARFVNAFVSTPVCSPSRASFLTGLYSTQLGITDWISPQEADAGLGLPPGAVTWPEIVRQHGYATALVGKWHLGTKPQFHPRMRGFDHFFGFLEGGNQPMNPTLEVDGTTQTLKGALPDLLTDDAIRFVETNRSQPFALLLHFRAPHRPFAPVPEQDRAAVDGLDPSIPQVPGLDVEQVKEATLEYYASIHSIDRNLGRLLEKLEQLQLNDKTIVLFTSDHGYNLGHHGLWSKGNAFWMAGGVHGPTRPNMFEESIRVPLLIRWPGVVEAGTQIDARVTQVDTLASVLGMLGMSLPDGLRQEGRDFSPLLRGQSLEWPTTVFGQYDLHNSGLAFMRMVRTPQWKLVRYYHANFLDELYHLEKDPEETTNLYRLPEHQEIREDLESRLLEWQRSIGDPVLGGVPRPPY